MISPIPDQYFCANMFYCFKSIQVLQTTATKAEKKLSKSAGGKGGDDNSEEDEEFDREAELGMAAEAELEHDQRVTAVVEGEVAAKGLLAAFEPLLLAIVGNECGQFESEVLRQAATLALTKYMCVSPAACELHLPLLFTCLQREKWASVRGNVVVALGDLAFRFPNAVEPWTSQIYRRLRDEDSNVRGQTLMVLTHLILNDMVKVKGQVSEMVLSLEDVHAPTADLARLFFQVHLSKENAK
jgi:condensin complex subunit 1